MSAAAAPRRAFSGASVKVIGAPGTRPGQVTDGVIKRVLGGPGQGLWTVQLLTPGEPIADCECWAAGSRGEAEAARVELHDNPQPVAWLADSEPVREVSLAGS